LPLLRTSFIIYQSFHENEKSVSVRKAREDGEEQVKVKNRTRLAGYTKKKKISLATKETYSSVATAIATIFQFSPYENSLRHRHDRNSSSRSRASLTQIRMSVESALSEIVNLNDLPVKPWQKIAATMFATGSPVHEISAQVAQPVFVVSEFLTSARGTSLLKSVLSDNEARLNDMLDAAAVDSILVLIRIRDTSASDMARISASREILSKTLPGLKARDPRRAATLVGGDSSPEDEIARLRKRVAGSI